MHFGFAGHVHACCQNGVYSFGDVTQAGLHEIWNGMRRHAMVGAFAAGRYPRGCEQCEVEHALGNRASTPAQAFDVFPAGGSEWPRQMEFTLSNRCNLACVQCNSENSSTIAKKEGRPPVPVPYGDQFFEQLPPFLEHLEIASFLGGEPFLQPEARRVWDLLIELPRRPVVRVTTNASIWNDRVEYYVNELAMHLAISIDGATPATYEAIRLGANYGRVIEIRDRMVAASRRYGGTLHLNYCLLRANWQDVGRFMLQADELDVDANIIPVFAPADQSLYTLPVQALAPIVAEMAAEDRAIRPRLGRNRDRWVYVCRMLRERVESTGSDGAREQLLSGILKVRSRNDERAQIAASEQLMREAEVALLAWAGGDCIRVTTRGDVVRDVDAPAWASGLHLAEWVGTDIRSLGLAASGEVGSVEHGNPRDLSDGDGLLLSSDDVLTTPDGSYRFRTLYAPLLGQMLIATPDAARL